MRKITVTALFGLLVALSTGVTLVRADWQGTNWITNGSVISSQKVKDNFDFLFGRVEELSALIKNASSTSTGIGGNGGNTVSGSAQATNVSLPCTAELEGTLRWTGEKLEICTKGNWVTFYANNYCRIEQVSQVCSIPFSCNCGKRGCQTCQQPGIQYQATITCPDTGATLGWSECQPT